MAREMSVSSKYYYRDYLEHSSAFVGKYKMYKDFNGWYHIIIDKTCEEVYTHWDYNEFVKELNKCMQEEWYSNEN